MSLQPKPYLHGASFRPDIEIDHTVYPFHLPAVREMDRLRFHPDVTFLVGENGSGKSTIIEALAVAWGFNAEGGSKNFHFSTTAQSHSNLADCIRLSRSLRRPYDGFFLRAESYFNVASNIQQLDEDDHPLLTAPRIIESFGGVSLHEQSHGESFMALLLNRFRGGGLYILDEPEAALSPMRQFALLRRMHDLVLMGSQFIVATHSPIVLAYPRARIYLLGEHGIRETAYEETDHYVITREFLNNREGLLRELLSEDGAE